MKVFNLADIANLLQEQEWSGVKQRGTDFLPIDPLPVSWKG